MKKILLSLFLLATFAGFSQVITVNPNSHTADQLVRNVLVNNACLVQVTNPGSTTGTAFGSTNGIAYYQNTNPAFNVGSSGVLLTTGQAVLSPGPNTSVLNGGNTSATWGGDAGLEAALASAGISINSKNATVLEFDFVPNTSNFSFDFLFASEEYGQFQCESNDAFVVLLTPQGMPTQNVALIPSTTTPITVSTIRNILYNTGCPSANASFFGSLNVGGLAATSPINYNGQTTLMRASATVVPNVPYHIRFVIADDGEDDGTDGDYDSAVFIPAGSLNLGQRIFERDLTVANGNALCFGQSYTLNTNLDPDLYEFSWTRNGGAPIPGQTGPSLVVTTPGDYAVTLTRTDLACTTTQTIKIEYLPEVMAPTASNLLKCDNGSGTYTYDLTVNTPILKQGLDPATVVTYHPDQTAAAGDTGSLPTTYVSASGVTVWARVELPNGCAAIRPFQLLSSTPPTATQPQNITVCESAQGANNAVVDLTLQNAVILNGQSNTENQILYFTSLTAAQLGTPSIATPESYTGTTQTIYVRVQKTGDATCHAITQFQLNVKPLVVLPAPSVVNSCNSYTLPAIPQASYYTGIGGTGTMYAAGTVVTTSQTLYIYGQTGGTPNCSNQSTVEINIIDAQSGPGDISRCVSYTLPPLPIGEYRDAPAGGGNIIPAGTQITTTQTIYFFIPTAASCTQTNSFIVTITSTPVVTQPVNFNSCGPYTLPALPSDEDYYTGPGGSGTMIPEGTEIAATQTLYVYATNPSNPTCTASSNPFTITVTDINIGSRPDRVECGNYFLPNPGVGRYFTAPNGGGTQLSQGYSVTSTMTIYVYAISPTDPTCSAQDEFTVTINPRPIIPSISDVTTCNSYTLPPLAVGNYYTAANGGGTMLPANTVITESQRIHVYATSPEGCPPSPARSFMVTILNIEDPGDRTECTSYALPALAQGRYYTGPNGTGTQLQAGTNISTTQTIYIRAVSNTTPQCVLEESFIVTIVQKPVLATIPNQIACTSYTLPALPAGANYYTGPNGTGTIIPAGTVLTTSQTVRIWAANPALPTCGTPRQFTLTIITGDIAPADVTACASYTLPNLPPNRVYRNAPAGAGQVIAAGTQITTSQTIYVYSNTTAGTNCTDNNSFDVTILPQVPVDSNPGGDYCTNYTLPVLTNGRYYTGPGGTGTMLNAGDVITSTQMIYIFNSSNAGINCSDENSFLIQIRDITVTDIADQLVCDQFILPDLTVGKYYTGPNGTGSEIPAGTPITTNQTIYIYAATTSSPVCTDQEDFTVTIKPAPAIDTPANVGSCGPYTLPALTAGNYFTQPGGGGTPLSAGQVITDTTQLYIFGQTGGTPNCVAEHMFTVFINPGSPADVTECDTYTLPAPPFGSYFSAPGGTGAQLNAGDVITSTQDVYVYMPGQTGTCMDNIKFTVTINNTPVIAPIADVTECDSYVLPALAVGQYRSAAAGQGVVYPAGHVVTTSETIYVYAESATSPNCVSEESFNVQIIPTPLVDARSDVPACFYYDLQPLVVGTYWTAPDGPHGTGTQLFPNDPSGHITQTQLIYIYAENTADCRAQNSFTVTIFSIDVDQVANATECDSYTFQPLTVGKYYAQTGGPAPGNPEILPGTIFTTPGTHTFYVYGETPGREACPNEKPFTVTIYQTPVIDESQTPVTQCNAPFILPAMAAGTVGQYYTGPNGTGTQLSAGASITTPQTIYVYASSGPNAECFKEHSFVVNVNMIDVVAPAPITICGVYTLPVLAQGNYYTGPNGTGTQLNAGDQITTTQDIYVWAVAASDASCTDQDMFTVTIITAPQIFQPAPLHECSIDDAGERGIFDLNPALLHALGGQADTDVSIHETIEQATIAGGLEITNPGAYQNLEAFTQTLYIRVYSTVSDCFSIVQLQLIVHPRPVATEPEDLEVCDGPEGDGFALFNLSSVNAEVLGTMNPADFSVTFHTDAQAITSPITNPLNYNSDTRTIYVKVTDVATLCFDIVPLNLVVNPLPVAISPVAYTLCDVTAPANNEREIFNLNSKIAEITGNATGVNVTFHRDMAGAIGRTGQITNPEAFENESTVQTLFVRVENAVTECYRIVLMDIRVEPLPLLLMPTPAETTMCDPDGDGFVQFDLQALLNDMLNGGTNIQISLHETALDAESGFNPITNLTTYPNEETPVQTIYVRAVNTITGCVRFTQSFNLYVNPSPQMPDLTDIDVCDTDSNINGETIVNLTQQNAVIEAALGTGLTIHYFDQLARAEIGSPRITNPATYLATDGQQIWVRVTDAQGCFGIESFFVNVDVPLQLTSPTALTLCDNKDMPNDGVREFDLTVKENEILGPFGVGQGFVLTYFVKNTTQPNINPITTPGSFTQITTPEAYTNPSGPQGNPQTLFVIATSPGGCKSFTTLTIRVLPNPVPDMNPDPIELCDDNNSPDGLESFNLTLAAADIRNGDTTAILTYYTTEALAEAGVAGTEIPNPAAHIAGTGNVYVRMQANTGNPADPGCYRVVTLPLVVNPLPALGTGGVIPVYAICEIPFDGKATFTLNSHIPEILVNQNASDYTIRFFKTPAEAALGTPAMPNIYENETLNSQIIYVRVDNNTTDCTAIAPMELRVEQGATATLPDSTPFQICDTDSVNNGMFEFDLTTVEPEVLNGQNPAQFIITYHELLTDAEDGLNPIAAPTAYTNTVADAQTIYVRVVNSLTSTPCDAITQIDIIVERLPEPVIESDNDYDTICVDFVTGNVNSSVTLRVPNITGTGYTYEWFRGTTSVGTADFYEAREEGAYTVVVKGPLPRNCTSLSSPVFTVIKSGPAAIPAGTTGYTVSNAFSDTQTITINIDGYGQYEYRLGNGPWQASNVFTDVPFGEQTVTVRDVKTENPSCGNLEIEVSIIDYPNFFTPNGDGYNDKWNIVGLGGSNNNADAKIYIFDRFGKLVKQIASEGEGWDGTFMGSPMPADDYWFTVEYKEEIDGVYVSKEFKSHFSLKR